MQANNDIDYVVLKYHIICIVKSPIYMYHVIPDSKDPPSNLVLSTPHRHSARLAPGRVMLIVAL